MNNFLIRAGQFTYRAFLSPLLHFLAGPGFGCRYEVTCGDYFFRSVREHGWFRGGFRGLSRVLSCW